MSPIEAEGELAARTKGARLVGTVGDDKFRVTLSRVKKRVPKKQPQPLPIRRWSSSSYSWPRDPADTLLIPPVPFQRRVCGIAATVTGQVAPWTELAVRVTPGAGDAATLLASTTAWSGGAMQRVVYQLLPVDPSFSGFSSGSDDVAVGVIPGDLWIAPEEQLEVWWPSPTALAAATIHGVVIRWENSLAF